ncbi:MAG: hypothetical protein ACOY33_07250 [Pseudomonadota bacterium]
MKPLLRLLKLLRPRLPKLRPPRLLTPLLLRLLTLPLLRLPSNRFRRFAGPLADPGTEKPAFMAGFSFSGCRR